MLKRLVIGLVLVAVGAGAAAIELLPRYDVEPDGFVDMSDIAKVTVFFGQSCAGS